MNTFTVNITEPLQILKADQIYRLSVKANGGTVTILGDMPELKFASGPTLARSPITLFDGQSSVYQAAVMNGMELLITPGSGSADIEIFQGAN